jgi:hypothetical protein
MWTHRGKTGRGYIKKKAIYKAGREASGESNSAKTLILNF